MTVTRRDVLQLLGSTALASVIGNMTSTSANADDALRSPIKLGQIGVGHAHASKLSVYRNSPDYEVVGIVEPNEERRNRVQSQPAFRDLPWLTQDQLLNTSGLQAVLVETEVRDSLEHSRGVYCSGDACSS